MIVVPVWGICNFPHCNVAEDKIRTGNTWKPFIPIDRWWLTVNQQNINHYISHFEFVVSWLKLSYLRQNRQRDFDGFLLAELTLRRKARKRDDSEKPQTFWALSHSTEFLFLFLWVHLHGTYCLGGLCIGAFIQPERDLWCYSEIAERKEPTLTLYIVLFTWWQSILLAC